MAGVPARSQPYPALLPDLLPLHALPLRLQRMIAVLLAHEEALCRYNVGHVELHWHGENLEAKLGCNLLR